MAKSRTSMDPEFAVNLCHEFEQEWSADKKTNLKKFLKKVEKGHRGEAFTMLVEIEIDRRNAVGQKVDPEDYVKFGDGAYQLVKKLVARGLQYDETEAREPQQQSKLAIHFKSDQIGPYKLLEEIGTGGMGMVWVAEQEEPVYRKVALKLIKPELGSSELIARFDAERQALAMMDHPNIAKFLDAGTTDEGTPYFAMELVQGTPINEFCDRNHVPVHERLQLFVSICRAVQHAHQKGIIHRDLKPTNILVQMEDGVPTPKVIDFGLAKALDQTQKLTDKTLFTEFGHVVGTIQYMSPEQATLDAMGSDSRSDIYSLGIVLFELLVGSTPIDRKTVKENAFLKVLELVREKEPPRPSSRLMESDENLDEILQNRCIQLAMYRQVLESDLDWVVVKALEKEPARRYETANQLGREVERILNGEPIEARPPSLFYIWGKFFKKNRIMVGSSVAGVALVLFFLVITSFLALRTTDFRLAAEEAKSDLDKVAKDRDQWKSKYDAVTKEPSNGMSNGKGQATQGDEKPKRNPSRTKPGNSGSGDSKQGKATKITPRKVPPTAQPPQKSNSILFDELLDLQLNQLSNSSPVEISRLIQLLEKLPADEVIKILNEHGVALPSTPEFVTKKDGKHNWLNPGFKQDDRHPVVNVSYWDAVAFCDWLTEKEKASNRIYRLPFAFEWEHACRAKTTTLFHNGDDPSKLIEVANIDGDKDDHLWTAPVGAFASNRFGLHDMHGNVMEWVQEQWRDSGKGVGIGRVRRGGGFSTGKPWNILRASYRFEDVDEVEGDATGFRVVLEIDDEQIAAGEPLAKSFVNSIGMEMRLVPAGEYHMGNQNGFAEEKPYKKVTVDKPFYMGTYEVTVGQFKKFVTATKYTTYAEKNGGSRVRIPVKLTEAEKARKLIELLASRFELQLTGEDSILGEWVVANPLAPAGSLTKLIIADDGEGATIDAWFDKGRLKTGPRKLRLVGGRCGGPILEWIRGMEGSYESPILDVETSRQSTRR